jgi:hypothetical protein
MAAGVPSGEYTTSTQVALDSISKKGATAATMPRVTQAIKEANLQDLRALEAVLREHLSKATDTGPIEQQLKAIAARTLALTPRESRGKVSEALKSAVVLGSSPTSSTSASVRSATPPSAESASPGSAASPAPAPRRPAVILPPPPPSAASVASASGGVTEPSPLEAVLRALLSRGPGGVVKAVKSLPEELKDYLRRGLEPGPF